MLSCLGVPARADWTPLGRIDTESIQSLSYALSAFSRSAGFPYNLTDLNQFAARGLCLPNLSGTDVRQPVTVHLLVDGNAPRANARIASLAVIEPADNGASMLAMLNAVYAHGEEQVWGVLFSRRREGFSGSEQLAVSIHAGRAYVTDTPDLIAWALKPGRPTILAPAASGQMVLSLVPGELAACLSATNAALTAVLPSLSMVPTGQVERAFARLPALLQETDSLSLSLNANGYALSASLTLGFKPNSPLHVWVGKMNPIERWYGSLAPDDATLVTISGQSSRGGWRERLGWTLDQQLPSLEDLVGDSLKGESISYLSKTHSADGLVFASVARVTDSVESRKRLSERLNGMHLPTGLTVRRAADRRYAGADIQCFFLTNSAVATSLAPSLSGQSSVMVALANLLSKVTVLEATVIGQDLALVVGPPGAIESVIDDLKSGKPPHGSLPERCRRLSPNLPLKATSITLLRPVAMLRQTAAILPGFKPEQLEKFAMPGDGLIAWTSLQDGKYTGALQISANEVDALQSALTRGRPVIQEIMMQMVMQQILRQPAAERERNAPPAPVSIPVP
jgi:hypothetical protein